MFKLPSLNLPLITTVIILLGLFNLNDYYRRFNIEIYNYIDVSEILFSFTNIFPVVIFCLLYAAMNYATIISDRAEDDAPKIIWRRKNS